MQLACATLSAVRVTGRSLSGASMRHEFVIGTDDFVPRSVLIGKLCRVMASMPCLDLYFCLAAAWHEQVCMRV